MYHETNLTSLGQEQVRTSGLNIKAEIEENAQVKIYHSQLRRTQQSAEILAEIVKIPLTELVERYSLNSDQYLIGQVVDEITGLGIIISHAPDLTLYLRQRGSLKMISYGEYHKVTLP